MNRLSIGRLGERKAEEFLKNLGYRILERNYRSRFGEIDLIAEDHGTVVFVEVKLRGGDKFGTPLEAITHQKLSKVIKTSQFYLLNKPNQNIRYDAMEIIETRGKLNINHVKNITF